MLAADQLPLHKELPIQAVQAVDVDIEKLARLVQAAARTRAATLRFHAVLVAGPADEREIRQIPGQADAAADDDVGLGARAPQPLAVV